MYLLKPKAKKNIKPLGLAKISVIAPSFAKVLPDKPGQQSLPAVLSAK